MDAPEKRVLACNYAEATSAAKKGARAYVLDVPGDPARIFLLARSRGGRWIETWERRDRLWNWRLKTIVPTDPVYDRVRDAGDVRHQGSLLWVMAQGP